MTILRHSSNRLAKFIHTRHTVSKHSSTFGQTNRPTSTSNIHANLDTTSPRQLADHDSLFTQSPLIFDTHKMVNYLNASGFSQQQSEAVTEAMVRLSQQANRYNASQMVTKNEFVSLRSELSILEKADFALLKTDINAIEKRMETSVAEIYTALERVENRVIKWVIAVAGAIGLAIVRLTTTSNGSSGSGGGDHRFGSLPPPSNVKDEAVIELRKKGFQIINT